MHADPDNPFESNWINHVEHILNSTGLGNIWINEGDNFSCNNIKMALKLRLSDNFKQKWLAQLSENSQCTVYRMFKAELAFSDYLSCLDFRDRVCLSKFRCRNHSLPITRNRFHNNSVEARK